jgi:uncharacterized protein (TIGR03437 family)
MLLPGTPQALNSYRFFPFFSYLSYLILVLVAIGLQAAAQTPSLDSEEQTVLRLINEYRAQNGLVQLRASISLTRAADWMSGDMASKNYFSHTDSEGRDPFARMAAFGYGYPASKGENIAAGYQDAVRTFNQWKNSPGHNATMLNPNFRVIGIARVYGSNTRYRWYWTNDFGSYVDATLDGGSAAPKSVRTANAANFFQVISPDAIAASFGDQLSQTTVNATSLPLPASLAGISITVNDIAAPMIYVSPAQINYIVPANVDPGTAMVKVINNGGVVAEGTVDVEQVSPSIFTVSANGQGIAAAQTTFDGVSFQPVVNPDGTPRALSVGTAARPNYLVLYGTGLRRRSQLSSVRVTIGGVALSVDFLGAHSRLVGVDQLNVRLPQELRGRGNVDVVVTIDGRVSNVARINIGN